MAAVPEPRRAPVRAPALLSIWPARRVACSKRSDRTCFRTYPDRRRENEDSSDQYNDIGGQFGSALSTHVPRNSLMESGGVVGSVSDRGDGPRESDLR